MSACFFMGKFIGCAGVHLSENKITWVYNGTLLVARAEATSRGCYGVQWSPYKGSPLCIT